MLVKQGIAKGTSPCAGARGVLAPSSSASRRRRHKGTLESPDKLLKVNHESVHQIECDNLCMDTYLTFPRGGR